MEEDENQSYYYSINTSEVVLKEVETWLDLPSNSNFFVAFLSTPSLFYSFTTAQNRQSRSVLLTSQDIEKKKKGLQVEHYRYTDPTAVPDYLSRKCCFVVAEPEFISPEVIRSYLLTIDALSAGGNTKCRVIFATIVEHEKLLGEDSNNGLVRMRFLPAITGLVYQYSFFVNYESKLLGEENSEILKDEEAALKFVDVKKFKAIKKQKLEHLSTQKWSRSEKKRVKNPNAKFYRNEIPSQPRGDLVENIISKWTGNYALLELHHGYIQWLFPYVSSGGMNYHSCALNSTEIEMFGACKAMQRRWVASYELILDFYGLKLVDSNTGEIARGENWESRFAKFTFHNNLRITRILKCMHDLKVFASWRRPLVRVLVDEVLRRDNFRSSFNSLMEFWIPQLDSEDQVELKKMLDETGLLKRYLEKNRLYRKSVKNSSRGRYLKKGVKRRGGEDMDPKKKGKVRKRINRQRTNFRKFRKKGEKKKDPFSNFLVQ